MPSTAGRRSELSRQTKPKKWSGTAGHTYPSCQQIGFTSLGQVMNLDYIRGNCSSLRRTGPCFDQSPAKPGAFAEPSAARRLTIPGPPPWLCRRPARVISPACLYFQTSHRRTGERAPNWPSSHQIRRIPVSSPSICPDKWRR